MDYIRELLLEMLYVIPILLISLPMHEYAHGWAAYKCGDPTAKHMGRLTLNPIKHIDPIGALVMLVAHFGWAKPVPINPRNFRNYKKGMILVSIAGVTANILLAFIGCILFILSVSLMPKWSFIYSDFGFRLYEAVTTFLSYFTTINAGLAVFNLLPIPPLDGSKLLSMFLPPKILFKIRPYEAYLPIVLLVLLLTGALSTPLNFIVGYLLDGLLWVCDKILFFL